MEEFFIFKYQDTQDLNYAFIIAKDEDQARTILRISTELEVVLKGTRNLMDFPLALEHLTETESPVYINNINPF